MAKRSGQDKDLFFALDIGTRSIIGVVGRVEDERFQVLAIEKEEHGKRAMLDGQIEDIGQVAKVARRVTDRLEERLDCTLERVCVAAAGRALRTEKGSYTLEFPEVTHVTNDSIGRLESGAVAAAEAALGLGPDGRRRFYLVGYTVSSYQLDHYPMTTLRGHNGQLLEAEVVATFLPGEVVESLYSVMEAAGLEVASLTLEPIAALNAAIPADLRLLNLVLADIGAGTSDIAVCRDGAVVGYTMATIAGDEITEEIMRRYLVPFATAERMKTQLHEANVKYRDVLGMEHSVTGMQLRETIQQAAQNLAQEISQRVVALNGAPPSALFLAGGGSKLEGLRELVAEALEMDENRVALAGNNYEITAFSDEYDLNDPELATPLGIAVSAGLGLISDSYRIMLNGKPAKLFRSGSLTVLELLMMNGYSSPDLLGRTGKNLSVTVNGQRMLFRGEPATPCTLTLNGEEIAPSALVYAGDNIQFTPAVPGAPAQRTVKELLGADFVGGVTVNGRMADLDTRLNTGDQVVTSDHPIQSAPPAPPPPKQETQERQRPVRPESVPVTSPPLPRMAIRPAERPRQEPVRPAEQPKAAPPAGKPLTVVLNGRMLALPGKAEGGPYYVMDLLDHSGVDFEHLDRGVELKVNGAECAFTQELRSQDDVVIRYLEQ
ncbi:cell division protein FtsA [Pseudoflavonifractor sp. 60]|uniref:cell division FtsA domain-containing protein n=1 Tax=Pseudoflavonifractor sp. 60 TaxID=2304576 RepID=UPI00136A9FD7|nr:cell division FtsA domain-containing protein [Pseudoflavonifractor sp. 60]NBI66751.1 cell division protein FtsA [Pseudoflavonifractor sp. 60]